MRVKRAKAARRTLRFFSMHGGLDPPYHVLLDGTFLVACVRQKLPLKDRLQKLLQGDKFTLSTTRSALDELDKLPGDVFAEARRLGLDECEIIGERTTTTTTTETKSDDDDGTPTTRSETKLGRVGTDVAALVVDGHRNDNPEARRYLVATQDEQLADALRRRDFTPVLRISRAVLLLEAPSASCRARAERAEGHKLVHAGGTMTSEERAYLNRVRRTDLATRAEVRREEQEQRRRTEARLAGPQPTTAATGRKRHRAKEPNPLSCKKKKAGGGSGGGKAQIGSGEGKKRRKRTKK